MKNLIMLILLLFSLEAIAQETKMIQKIVKTDREYQVFSNGESWKVDTTTFTVKVKERKELGKEYKVIRSNKLGYIDLSKPADIPFEKYLDILIDDKDIVYISCSTFGKWLSFTPNDSLLSNQWYLSAINAYQAWDITTGSPNVIVAIPDATPDWSHPDLGLGRNSYQNVYLNPGEDVWSNLNNPATGNGIDDDNNGFVDDWKGWNFYTNSNDIRGPYPYFHGTFVAGIIGAKTNNISGIAGVSGGNGNKGVQLLLYNVGDSWGPIQAVIDDAILAAVDNGAKIIQFSLGVAESSDINDAIQYATDHDVLIVCAVGNDGPTYPIAYPASHPDVIGVGATDQDNQRASFSRIGNQLEIVAPGVNIYSTTLNHSYTTFNGTSFSAPQVSAVASLLLSVDSTLTPSQIRGILCNTAQKVGGYNYQTIEGHPYGTWNNEMGYGLLDAYAAVQEAQCVPASITNKQSRQIQLSRGVRCMCKT